MPHIRLADTTLHYVELGDPDVVPLVLLHGGGGSLDDWDAGWQRLAPDFAARYRVLLLDHRGHGGSDASPDGLGFDLLVRDLAAFIEALGLAPVHIAGMSDGGITALGLALARPELLRSIVCVGANYRVDDTIRAALAGVNPPTLEQDFPGWADDLARRHDLHHEPGYWRVLLTQVIANAREHPRWSEDDLRTIRVPALLIAGEDDPFANLEQMVTMKRAIPGAEWLIVNHAWHVVQNSHPEIVGPRMLDFFARHDVREGDAG